MVWENIGLVAGVKKKLKKAWNDVGKGSEKNDEAEESNTVEAVKRWHTL